MKRIFDIVAAALLLVVLSPVMLGIAIAIVATSGLPVLFRQKRPGLHGRVFTISKFRTMRAPRAGETWNRNDEERLTGLGRWLRRTSADELPELWNVLRGDMSLVGPRPLVVEYLDKYTPRQLRRHDVRPGVTGLAQVSGREEIPFSQRLELDVWYVENGSFLLDLRILWRTFATVARAQGVDSVTLDAVDDLGLASDRSRFLVTDPAPPDNLSSGHPHDQREARRASRNRRV